MTPSGIEPATLRFVAEYLNHCAIAVSFWLESLSTKKNRWLRLMLVSDSVIVPDVIIVAENLRLFEKKGAGKKE